MVAVVNDEIIGAIIAEEKITFTPNAAFIKSIFIKEEWQGKKVGRALMEKCIEALKEKGIESVSLTVDEKNKAAVSLYEKYGFEPFRILYLKKL